MAKRAVSCCKPYNGLLFVFATRETERLLCDYIGKAHPSDNFHMLKKTLM